MLPTSLQEFDALVTTHMAQHAKRYGKTLTRSQGEADFRLHYSSIAAIEPELRKTGMQESAVDAWEAMGLSPEAAKIAARVVESESKAVADFNYEDWRAVFGRR